MYYLLILLLSITCGESCTKQVRGWLAALHSGSEEVSGRWFLVRVAPYCDISSSSCTHGSYAHLNGHVENGGSKNSGTYMYDSKKWLQPIGADAKPKTSETTRLNGYVKRTSLVMDGTNLKGSHSSLTLSASQESRKSSSSSTADQAISDTQFLPPIVWYVNWGCHGNLGGNSHPCLSTFFSSFYANIFRISIFLILSSFEGEYICIQ